MSAKCLGRVFGLLAMLAVLCAGCGKSGPKTYVAKGKIVYKDGSPVRGGAVEFRSVSGGTSSMGEIDQDGRFTLRGMSPDGPLTGSLPGEFRVTVLPDQGKGQGAQPIRVPTPYTVKPDGTNDFNITLNTNRPKKS